MTNKFINANHKESENQTHLDQDPYMGLKRPKRHSKTLWVPPASRYGKSNMESKKPIITALSRLLKPVVRLLLEMGFSFRDFNEVAKLVYVEVATESFGIRGRKTNMSRVAILTGLTRREVSRLRKVLSSDEGMINTTSTVAEKVLTDWYQLPEYTNQEKQPRLIPLTGSVSLTSLADSHRGDIPTTAVIKELQRFDAIEVSNGIARVKSRHFSPSKLNPRSLLRAGSVMGDIAETIKFNMLSNTSTSQRFEAQAYTVSVPLHATEAFDRFLDRKASDFLADVNSWLADHSSPNETGSLKIGAGVYAIGSPHSACANLD